jgi:hypothetical protein
MNYKCNEPGCNRESKYVTTRKSDNRHVYYCEKHYWKNVNSGSINRNIEYENKV